MAKRSRGRERDYASPIATRSGVLSPRPLVSLPRLYSDRRTWSPDRHLVPAPATVRSASRIVMRPGRRIRRSLRAPLGFADPRRVMVCVRRATRRQVLFAKSGGGAPKRKQRFNRRNEWSNYSCR